MWLSLEDPRLLDSAVVETNKKRKKKNFEIGGLFDFCGLRTIEKLCISCFPMNY